jgi:hypothetical protein
MRYPNDASGDVFRRMEEHNFDFSKPHPVEFFAILSTEKEADIIAKQYLDDHKKGNILINIETKPYDQGGMELILVKEMMVTYENVTSFENTLQERVSMHEGYLDGWGVMQ